MRKPSNHLRTCLAHRHSTAMCEIRLSAGFTLIELMVAVAIVSILAAIAIPSYSNYILRGHLSSATTGLSAAAAQMEQYFQDNRTYGPVSASITPPCLNTTTSSSGDFTITCGALPGTTPPSMTAAGMAPSNSATGYTIVAYGNSGSVVGFYYSLSSTGGAQWSVTGSVWGSAIGATCWIVKQGQTC